MSWSQWPHLVSPIWGSEESLLRHSLHGLLKG